MGKREKRLLLDKQEELYMYTNADSLLWKHGMLKLRINRDQPDIIAITGPSPRTRRTPGWTQQWTLALKDTS